MVEKNLKLKKNILSNLLTTKFEEKLNFLEQRTNNYFSLINTSKNIVGSVTNTCITLEKKIKEQIDLNNKKKQVSPINQRLNSLKRNTSIRLISNNSLRQNKNILKSNKNQTINIEMKKSKSNINLLRNNQYHRESTVKNSMKKGVNNLKLSTILKFNNNNNNIHELKRSKTERNMRSNKKSQNLNKGNKKLHKSTKNLLKLDKNKSIDSSIISNNKLKDIQSKTFDDDKIAELENNLMLNESLLVGNNDLDFIPKGLLINSNDLEITYHNLNFNALDYAEQELPFILKYLSIQDYINLISTCKVFKKIIYEEILSHLENEKLKYNKKLDVFNLQQILTPYDKNNLILSKASLKAVNLLNQNYLTRLFTKTSVPIDDILLIYHIYFQLINHPISKEFNNKEIFWKKCIKYFTEESNGKIGDLLLKSIKDNIDLSSENIYKVIHILNDKFEKISPSYFATICGTTGLFVFFIKDIFDFLGIFNDKKINSNSYWTFKKVIDAINNKIEKIKSFLYHN